MGKVSKKIMKIAILGGTGDFGEGLAIRWARKHEVIIGSRDEEKAINEAKNYASKAILAYQEDVKGKLIGMKNEDAVKEADAIVISIPSQFLVDFLKKIKENINKNAIIISPVVPIAKKDSKFIYDPSLISPTAKSAGEEITKILETNKVVSALHTIPAKKLADPYSILNYDLPYCSSDKNSIETFLTLAKDLDEHLNPLYVGDIELSYLIESITVTILNISLNTRKWNLSIKFV
jgi:NADPH-dependent F420 reductase